MQLLYVKSVRLAMATTKPAKRKRVVLTIEQKVEIMELLDKSVSYAAISEKFGIGRSTVVDMKNRLKFKADMVYMGVKRKVKVMKLGDDKKFDQVVYLWFKQKRMEGVPISGALLREKALGWWYGVWNGFRIRVSHSGDGDDSE